MSNWSQFTQQTLGPWTLGELLLAFGFLVGGFVLRAIFNAVVATRLKHAAEKTETEADDMAVAAVFSPFGLILPMVGIFLAVRTLLTRPEWVATSDKVFMVVIILVVTWTFFKLADAVSILLNELAEKTDSKLDDQVVPLVRKASKIFLAILAWNFFGDGIRDAVDPKSRH